MQLLGTSLLTAYLLSSLAPGLRKGLIDDKVPKYVPFKLRLGNDETVFVLREDDSLRYSLEHLENLLLGEERPLATQSSFVEVKPSPIDGLGLFAAKDFVPGDFVMSERPIVSALYFP
jgi:hypothetical protein